LTDPLGPRTGIPCRWLTGQDTLTWCVTGAMMPCLLTTTAPVARRRISPLMKRIHSNGNRA